MICKKLKNKRNKSYKIIQISKNSYIWFFVYFQVAIKFVDKRFVKDLKEVRPKQQK